MSNRLEEMKTFFKRVIPKDKQKCVATTIIIQLKLSCYLKIVCDLLKWWRLKYYTFKNSYMFETKLSLKSSGIEKFIYGNLFPICDRIDSIYYFFVMILKFEVWIYQKQIIWTEIVLSQMLSITSTYATWTSFIEWKKFGNYLDVKQSFIQ